MTRRLQPCGTYAAYQRHIKAGEPACAACSVANAAYMAAFRRREPAYRLRGNAQSKALHRAKQRLANRYPNVLARYYAEELAKEADQ